MTCTPPEFYPNGRRFEVHLTGIQPSTEVPMRGIQGREI